MLLSIPRFFKNPLISLLFVHLTACTKEPQYIETVSPSENTAITSIDTFQTRYIIQRLDSFQTSGTSLLISGVHQDPYFGKTISKPFFRFTLPSIENPIKENNNLYYDSLVLIMNLSKDYYGDTSSNFSINAFRLQEAITSESNLFFNTASFAAFPDALGSFNQRIRPNVTDSITLRLSDNLGREIFGFYKSNSAEISNTENFQRYFKGLKIEADEALTNVLYGFTAADSTIRMRLYYHADVAIKEKKTLDFNFESGQFQFNSISTNTTGTPLQHLLPGKEISSTDAGNQFYIFPLAGIKTLIQFPSIKNILTIDGYVSLLNAALYLKPAKGSYDQYPLFSSLPIYFQSSDLNISGPLQFNSETQSGNLSLDDLYGENSFYSYNISAYTASEIVASIYTTEKLIPYPISPLVNSGTFSFQRMVGVDGSTLKYRSNLVLQMLTYKK